MHIEDGIPYRGQVRALIVEYVRRFGRDLAFQNLDDELVDLASKYAPPRGRLLVAVDDAGNVFGCVAYHCLGDGRCEMKRLYVRPDHRGAHAGRALAGAIISLAREDGYREMVLDTVLSLSSALALYRSLGFEECEPYYHNPFEDVVYMRKDLL